MPDLTQEHSTVYELFGDGAITLYGRPFQGRLPKYIQSDIEVLQPPLINQWVWPIPRSLATTKGISN